MRVFEDVQRHIVFQLLVLSVNNKTDKLISRI
jgi:hypothetical protein